MTSIARVIFCPLRLTALLDCQSVTPQCGGRKAVAESIGRCTESPQLCEGPRRPAACDAHRRRLNYEAGRAHASPKTNLSVILGARERSSSKPGIQHKDSSKTP